MMGRKPGVGRRPIKPQPQSRLGPKIQLLGQQEALKKMQQAVMKYKVMRAKVDGKRNNVTARFHPDLYSKIPVNSHVYGDVADDGVINHLHIHNSMC
jgi:hypothetical protein